MQRFLARIRANAFLRNSIILFSGTMVVNVLNYAFHLIIGRMVTPAEYGEIESLFSLLAIILVPAAALTMIATKYAAGMKEEGNIPGARVLFRYLNRKVATYGAALFFVALCATPFVKQFLRIDESLPIVFLWVAMFFSFLNAVTVGILTGWQKFGLVNQVNIFVTVLKFIGTFIAIFFGYVVDGTVGALTAAILAGFLFSLWWTKKVLGGETGKEMGDVSAALPFPFASLKSYILPAFYGTLSIAILGNVDMVFAKHHLDPENSGEYGALTIVSKTIFFATGVITTVLFAMASAKSKQTEENLRTFFQATFLTVLVSGGAVAFFALFPEFVVGLLFGETYLGVSHLLPWFALAAGLYSLGNLFLQYLLSLHETRATLFFLALSSLEIAVLFFFGEGLYGIISITIATQLLAVLLGILLIGRKISYEKKALSRHPGL